MQTAWGKPGHHPTVFLNPKEVRMFIPNRIPAEAHAAGCKCDRHDRPAPQERDWEAEYDAAIRGGDWRAALATQTERWAKADETVEPITIAAWCDAP